jgi:hypothetical protein
MLPLDWAIYNMLFLNGTFFLQNAVNTKSVNQIS